VRADGSGVDLGAEPQLAPGWVVEDLWCCEPDSPGCLGDEACEHIRVLVHVVARVGEYNPVQCVFFLSRSLRVFGRRHEWHRHLSAGTADKCVHQHHPDGQGFTLLVSESKAP
jgi:hypothetical protein